MTYALSLPGHLLRYLDRVQPKTRDRLLDRLGLLCENPYDHDISKSLHGDLAGSRSSDLGQYRIIYDVEDALHVLDIIDIGPRGDIYKR